MGRRFKGLPPAMQPQLTMAGLDPANQRPRVCAGN